MRYVKLALLFIAVVVGVQTLPVIYHSNQFDEFVKKEVQRPRTRFTARGQITHEILNKAVELSVPLKEEDIDVSTSGRVIRVEVKYKIPIDLLVYSPQMRFRTVGGALLVE